jgi:hypothetical protein
MGMLEACIDFGLGIIKLLKFQGLWKERSFKDYLIYFLLEVNQIKKASKESFKNNSEIDKLFSFLPLCCKISKP